MKKNVFLDFSNNSGVTPLIASAQLGQIDIVQMLLEKGVDMAQRDKYDKTAYQRLFEYIRNNNISKQDMPVYKKILSQLKEPHSLKNNIKRWLKSIKNEWMR